MSPHDKDLCVDIFTENGLAESLTSPTDVCLIGIKSMYIRSPHDNDPCMDILTENGLAKSLTSLTDVCLFGII